MAAHYFDSSAWVKHYVVEPGTPAVDALLVANGPHFVARLGVVELHAAFAKRVRMRQLTPAEFAANLQTVRADILSGTVQVVQLTRGRFGDAARLIVRFGLQHNLRSLDALQLAVALRLQAVHPALTVVSADQAQLGVAAALGLHTILV